MKEIWINLDCILKDMIFTILGIFFGFFLFNFDLK